MEYEKGEWVARKSEESGLWHIETRGGGIYIGCCPPIGQANAQLIASAPDLHKALSDLYSWCNCKIPNKTIARVDKALAKAEGK